MTSADRRKYDDCHCEYDAEPHGEFVHVGEIPQTNKRNREAQSEKADECGAKELADYFLMAPIIIGEGMNTKMESGKNEGEKKFERSKIFLAAFLRFEYLQDMLL